MLGVWLGRERHTGHWSAENGWRGGQKLAPGRGMGMVLINVKVTSKGISGKGLGLSEPQFPELTVASPCLSFIYRHVCTQGAQGLVTTH